MSKVSGKAKASAHAAQKAARLRNLLDQKTGREKQTLRRYVTVLERRLRSR